MKNRHLLSACLFLGAIIIDQLSKSWGQGLPSAIFNRGFIMGHFSGQPDSVRIVALGFFAAVLFILYSLSMFLIFHRGRYLKYGLSVLMGGLFGNVIDKIAYGYTIDFIPFSLGNMSFVFNVADIFIWVGAAAIMWIVFRHDKLIWFEGSNRKTFLINPKEQLRSGIKLTFLVFNTSLMLGIFSFSFIRTSVPPNVIIMTPFILTFSSITIFLCLTSFITGIYLSHRSTGPHYAFELFVMDLISGTDRPFKLRESDNYKHLELTAEKLRTHFKNKSDSSEK